MSAPAGELMGFAYGEDLEEGTQRSLGYRLLAPAGPEPWCAEVEVLARRLQAAPYPEHWPASDLFCSVLLADGRRLVAVARYGLLDHTAAARRGGLELVGVVGPADLSVVEALALYRWLRQRRAAAEGLHALGGGFRREEAWAAAAPAPAGEPAALPVLPVRLWQEGAFLFAALEPGGPDRHLRLLEQAAESGWQWLPLVGGDFPLAQYAQRGPLVAWAANLAGVAVKLDRKAPESAGLPAAPPPRRPGARVLSGLLLVLLLGLLGGNLWYLRKLDEQLAAGPPAAPAPAPGPAKAGGKEGTAAKPPPGPAAEDGAAGRERFVAALYQLLREKGGKQELTDERGRLLERYEELAATNRDLRVRADNTEGKLAVAAVSVLAGRTADRVEAAVRHGLRGGYDPQLVDLVCRRIREQLGAER